MTVLISAGSKHGATAEIAARIAGRLADAGVEVELAEPAEVTSLDGVDSVVLGSGVYAGRWVESARSFAERFADELAERTVWLFSSGPVGDPSKPEGEPAEAAALAERIGAREHRVFAGRLERAALTFGERMIVRTLRAPEGDFRDWDEVDTWAEEITAVLAGPIPAA